MDKIINTIICGDCLDVMPGWDKEVADCCVTSPPYWGLRDYGLPPTKWPDGSVCCYGLEPTPELYVSHTVLIFQEVWRVLKPEGTLWLNLGDSYAHSGACGGASPDGPRKPRETDRIAQTKMKYSVPPGCKTKDLVGIPWMVAFALRSAGWYLRQDIIWHKPNPMPESVRDRCTKAHEYIFLLTKQPRYYCDMDAIREEFNYPERRYNPDTSKHKTAKLKEQGNRCTSALHDGRTQYGDPSIGRNKRSVWTVTTKPYSEAHFATFPPDLIEPCILAGCPEWVCTKCGKARVRIIEQGQKVVTSERGQYGITIVKNKDQKKNLASAAERMAPGKQYENKTTGWTDCGCGAGFRPGLVLDPFMGSGTTAMVAYENRRDYAGCELNPEYIKLNRADKAKEEYCLFESN